VSGDGIGPNKTMRTNSSLAAGQDGALSPRQPAVRCAASIASSILNHHNRKFRSHVFFRPSIAGPCQA